MKLSLLAFAAAAVVLASVPAQAQPDIVTDQLDAAVAMMAEDGYAPADDAVMGTLAEGDDAEFELDLEAGVHYAIIGFCDRGCSDLDLALADGGGNEVDSDYLLDDYPTLEFDSESTGTFVLSVEMATCSNSA
ncbi:MAG TPA: hypothetical protein VFR37_26000, partial [Longimicrobium sp.]|nr:hypothetical protein [Longimicrobium sp.]